MSRSTSQKGACRDEIISALVKARQDILVEVSALAEADQERVFLGIWSVKDVLAHLAGWDYTNMEAARYVMAG
ncbi:MAG TPA: hypothetical protein VI524_10885, partial [Anaerolineales bacterium]|nr:hypothetical protein [Anaerolineales bacterium]